MYAYDLMIFIYYPKLNLSSLKHYKYAEGPSDKRAGAPHQTSYYIRLGMETQRLGPLYLTKLLYASTNIPAVHTSLMAVQPTLDLEPEDPRKRNGKIGMVIVITLVQIGSQFSHMQGQLEQTLFACLILEQWTTHTRSCSNAKASLFILYSLMLPPYHIHRPAACKMLLVKGFTESLPVIH